MHSSPCRQCDLKTNKWILKMCVHVMALSLRTSMNSLWKILNMDSSPYVMLQFMPDLISAPSRASTSCFRHLLKDVIAPSLPSFVHPQTEFPFHCSFPTILSWVSPPYLSSLTPKAASPSNASQALLQALVIVYNDEFISMVNWLM